LRFWPPGQDQSDAGFSDVGERDHAFSPESLHTPNYSKNSPKHEFPREFLSIFSRFRPYSGDRARGLPPLRLPFWQSPDGASSDCQI
jgi:hypothetical protein